jgi:hypothetical protein
MENAGIIQLLSRHLFWDVDAEAMDAQGHRNFIILRVMDRGTHDDVMTVWTYYGEEAVKDSLLRASSLHRKTIAFFANQFHLRPEDFRAYRKNQELGTWVQ